MITADRLREILTYEPDTGLFRWRDTFAAGMNARGGSRLNRAPGLVVHAHRSKIGYFYIRLDGKSFLAHRLAWLYVHGELPKHPLVIDHINRDGFDNRLCNLRVATASQSICNSGMRSHNQSGFRGVSWHAQSRKWRAQLFGNGKLAESKLFKNIEDAVRWRDERAKELYGEFAILNLANPLK